MIHSKNLTAILGSCALVTAIGVMPTAVAANDVRPHEAPIILAQDDQAGEFDDETIEAFAEAQVRVAEIRALYTAEFESAETDEQRTEISEEASAEMLAAVEDTPGITIEEYGAVIEAANEDPALVERINEAIADSQT
ncbi:MAG: DUF4168 domain-containing protein [Roseicyclus sp.]